MKVKKNHIWLTIGVIAICLLLLYWLFATSLIQEDENMLPESSLTEQGVQG